MKFHSQPIDEHAEAPVADDGQLQDLVERFARRAGPQRSRPDQGNACFVLSLFRRGDERSAEPRLRELMGLVEAQGDRVIARQSLRLTRPDPRALIGPGVAEQIGEQAREHGADMLVVDAELSPSQARNLEDMTGMPVCDREAVILNVFERNATTRRARIQIEIAHLQYLRPRIRGIGLNMDQQAGGLMGARGPGETASELLARRLDGRLAELHRGLERLKRADRAQRKHRDGCARVVLVGYTNAGKTSLMNALTDAGLNSRDRPFETLDTTSRCLTRHGGDVLLSDTVGFIRQLPERLLASFESTLAEVSEATLLLCVLDLSDADVATHLETTESLLQRLGAADVPRLVVFNKLDRVEGAPDADQLKALAAGHPHVALSSRDAHAVAALRQRVLQAARQRQVVKEVFVPFHKHLLISKVYGRCRVIKTVATPRGTQFVIAGERHVVEQIASRARSRR